jgi:hypothetical protein
MPVTAALAVFPGGLVKNTNCGVCMECLRTCPHDNLPINLRPFGADRPSPAGGSWTRRTKPSSCSTARWSAAVLLGPWGAQVGGLLVGSPYWLAYALAFIVFVLGLLPGLFYLSVAAGRGWPEG